MTAKILFLDIETGPTKAAVWGLWGQNVGINQIIEPGRTICAAWKWGGKREVCFASEWMWEKVVERGLHDVERYAAFLQQLHEVLDEADIVVTYNGKKFDIPTLYKEFVQYKITPPAPFHHVDLYQTCRRQFRFVSNKLDFICQQLGLGAKTSHKGMQLWTDVGNGCPKAQRLMERYNKQDVVLLEKLYKHIRPWVKGHPTVSLLEGHSGSHKGTPACPSCGGRHLQHRGYRTTKTRRYKRYACVDCGSWSSETTSDKEIVAGVVSG